MLQEFALYNINFSEEEHRESNCRGIKNRKQLDAVRPSLVPQLTYQLYPIESEKSEQGDWNKTRVNAIDDSEINRRLTKCSLYTCTVRANVKQALHPPLQVVSTKENRSRRRNGFLQTLRCCARETGDRTEKTSRQYVDVCRRVRNHLSSLKAREKLAYVQ